MSQVQPDLLKSAASLEIPFEEFPQAIGLVTITIDTMQRFNKLIKSVRIVNDDLVANLTYRTQSPSGLLKTVDPISEVTFNQWGSFIQINPNAVTGAGLLELDLVEPRDAVRNRTFHR